MNEAVLDIVLSMEEWRLGDDGCVIFLAPDPLQKGQVVLCRPKREDPAIRTTVKTRRGLADGQYAHVLEDGFRAAESRHFTPPEQ